jgi:predicted ester cyclase
MEGTHRGVFAGLQPTGRPVKLPICHVTRVVDGKIVERIAYHDTAGILRQLA